MKEFTVAWWQEADKELARLWLEFEERARVTEATHEIDHILSVNPGSRGVEWHEGFRRLTVGPLHVLYTVEEKDRLATVWSVRLSHE